MTDISGVGALNATLIQSALQFAERKVQQSDQDGQELAQRRIEQARKGAAENDLGVPGNNAFDFEKDSVQKGQVDDVVDQSIRREAVVTGNILEASRRSDVGIEITLGNSQEHAQELANRIATENSTGAEKSLQDGIAQTEASLDSSDFTQTIDKNRERADASNLESRADRELGQVIDTFA
tara:strand:+ start:144 stop:686 length:543 start_codon:yes stop_codon:yes gene_type:complete